MGIRVDSVSLLVAGSVSSLTRIKLIYSVLFYTRVIYLWFLPIPSADQTISSPLWGAGVSWAGYRFLTA